MTNDEKIQLPGDLQESVLLPLARHRLSSWVHFNNREAIPQLETDAQRALERLNHAAPQKQRAQKIVGN